MFEQKRFVLYRTGRKSIQGIHTLPQSTRHIAPCAFIYCQSVTGVEMPQGLQSIGYWAFLYNSSLNNVVIPSSVTQIDDNVFGGCEALTSLTLAEGNIHYMMDGLMLYTIDGDTLLSCHKSADSVFLPAGLRAVGGFAMNSASSGAYIVRIGNLQSRKVIALK